MAWQRPLSCASTLSRAHAARMNSPSHGMFMSSTIIGRQPSSQRAIAAASSRSARWPPLMGSEVACGEPSNDLYCLSASCTMSVSRSGLVHRSPPSGTMSTPPSISLSTCETRVDLPAPRAPTTAK